MNAKDLLLHYKSNWEHKYASPFAISWARHGAIFKRLLKTFEASDIASAITHYLTDYRNDYHSNANHPVELFSSTISTILADKKKSTGAREAGAATLTDYERLEQARNAVKK